MKRSCKARCTWAFSREAGVQGSMCACEEERRHKNGAQHREKRVPAAGEHALVVESDHEEGHAGHEQAGEPHVLDRPRLVSEGQWNSLPIRWVHPLVEQVDAIQPMEVHQAHQTRQVVRAKSVLDKVSVHALNPMLVEVDGASHEDDTCRVHPVCTHLRVRRRQEVRNVVEAPSRGRIERDSEVRRQSPDAIEPRRVDDAIDNGCEIALDVRGLLAEVEAHHLRNKQHPGSTTGGAVQVFPVQHRQGQALLLLHGLGRPMRRCDILAGSLDVLDLVRHFHAWRAPLQNVIAPRVPGHAAPAPPLHRGRGRHGEGRGCCHGGGGGLLGSRLG
mmetsp:Transcript_54407/g.156454  ORF Transcript_54407/g.156454 Transcript_54407/m.156454 type:complete len:331 (+) Transcript_54407:449-1441(+)